MDSLIDLNTRTVTPHREEIPETGIEDTATSILKPRDPTPEEKRSIGINYGVIGLIVGLCLSVLAVIITLIAEEEISGNVLPVLIHVCLVLIVLSVAVAWVIGQSLMQNETENGYMRISSEALTFWTRNGEVMLPMRKVFGAGPTKETFFTFLRIYYLEENKRGFAFAKHNFKRYVPSEGPVRRIKHTSSDGYDIVRKTIMYHRRQRKKAGLDYANVPPFMFKAEKISKEQILFGKEYVAALFQCDGEKVIYVIVDKHLDYRIKVEMIESVKVDKVQSQYGVSKWVVNLKTNPASGYEIVPINVLQLPHSEEIEQYCRAIATAFPTQDSSYWD